MSRKSRERLMGGRMRVRTEEDQRRQPGVGSFRAVVPVKTAKQDKKKPGKK